MKKTHFKSPDLSARKPEGADLNRIAARAYEIWEREGCYHGRDREHWLRAEQELLQGATTTVDNPKSQPAPQQAIEPATETVDFRNPERESRRFA
jgi:hypothetical protein